MDASMELNINAQGSQEMAKELTLAQKIKEKCTTNDGFIYKLPLKVALEDENNLLASYEIGDPGAGGGVGKVLMLVGATGSGKTTLANSIVNYVYRVTWEDGFRFKLTSDESGEKSQARSQSKWITTYVLHQQEGFALPYTLTIIDTPGFGNTEGIHMDEGLRYQIQKFFCNGGHVGVHELVGNIQETNPISLSLTKAVLEERKLLEEALQGIQAQLKPIPELQNQSAAPWSTLKHQRTENTRRFDTLKRVPGGKYTTSAIGPEGFLPKLMDVNWTGEEIVNLRKRAYESMQKLKNIALKPDPLGVSDYIDLLIETEKQEIEPGYIQRIKYLQGIREKASLGEKLKKDFDMFER
ncbi:unnamed protein product [Darwinula stevensoni]|uniref:Septin-type G domain-containing protein n=1 Tax=Darwinula stevensoni TaxID=69355 RepID=A0A7R9A347_9CRUS|nr:unnamed protein product [Darwinula stevensoni]CAG0887059.1 unnamed protein product [Darwinula stevensoni]